MASIGDNINGYTLVEELNVGGFCIAYKVSKGGKNFFMKEYISPTPLMKEEYKAFTEHQDRLIIKLNKLGDNIEKTVEQFKTKYHYFQVKPFIVGQDLSKWMEDKSNGSYEKRKLVAIMMCEAVKVIHAAGIIHKDLKPGQFMVVKDSSPAGCKLILMDFDWSITDGICLQAVSTPGYGSLESEPKDISYHTDIFTVGIILCELLAGTGPYSHNHNDVGLTPPTWHNWVKNKRYQQPRSINSNISQAISDVIIKCLDPVASNRPTIGQVISALKDTKVEPEKSKYAGICLKSKGAKLLIPVKGKVDSSAFRRSFSIVVDGDGQPVYRYFEKNIMVLQVGYNGSDITLSTNIVKNKFTVNGKELSNIPMVIKNGDEVQLFSTTKSAVIAKFTVEFR